MVTFRYISYHNQKNFSPGNVITLTSLFIIHLSPLYRKRAYLSPWILIWCIALLCKNLWGNKQINKYWNSTKLPWLKAFCRVHSSVLSIVLLGAKFDIRNGQFAPFGDVLNSDSCIVEMKICFFQSLIIILKRVSPKGEF